MEFSVEFYETDAGKCPVQEFLDDLKASDPDDFTAILAGLVKLKNTSYTDPHSPRPLVRTFLSSDKLAN
jgi:hypothetical protein